MNRHRARRLGLATAARGGGAGLALLALLATACGEAPEANVSAPRMEAVATGNRPVVTLLTQLPGPTAAKAAQWTSTDLAVSGAIPDNWTPGLSSDITANDISAGACSALLGVSVHINVTHPRAAELMASISTISSSGSTLLTIPLFDGPSQAAGKSAADIAKISFPADYDVTALVKGSVCNHFRINVTDLAAKNTGTIDSWTLKRRTAWFPFAHDKNYYERLLFGLTASESAGKLVSANSTLQLQSGNVASASTTSSTWLPILNPIRIPIHVPIPIPTPVPTPVVKMVPNVRDYFVEESRNNLRIVDAGVYGPVTYSAFDPLESDSKHITDVVYLLEDAGFNFAAYDANHDGAITDDELEIIAIDNGSDLGGANRGNGCTTLRRSSLRVCSRQAFISQQVDFETLTHELSHSLGTIDLYGAWNQECYSLGLTDMSCTLIFPPDAKQTVYHDPWHRYKLGWITPYDPGIFGTGSFELGDETWADFYGNKSRPAILRNPKAGSNEYYLFEYRSGRGYDANVGLTDGNGTYANTGWGIVAWHVKEDGSGNVFNSATDAAGHHIYAVGPDNPVGGSQAWRPESGHFILRWEDGTNVPLSFYVEQPSNSANSQILHWSPAPTTLNKPTVRITAPADGASGTYGFGNNVVFSASVTASDGATDGATATWSSDLDGNIGSGLSMYYAFSFPGKRKITVVGKDKYGATNTATITYTATDVGPWVTIDTPLAGQTFYRNQPVRLQGSGHTPVLFAMDCSSLSWTSSVTPWIHYTPATDGSSNCYTIQSFNFLGDVTFTLTATDERGNVGLSSVLVHFVDPPPASPPIVTITSPTNGGRSMVGNVMHIAGTVTDPSNSGPVSYRWTVQEDGKTIETNIGYAATFDWLPSNLLPGYLSTAITLRLYGTSSSNQTTVASEHLYLSAPPR